ncbi:MAG: methylmalonyl Co-A mutase-associated GTPase MeaB [Acidobacteriota bacterium]|nr:methylmalonyl Co-A mutase-associated GTPase MeaB [Acidobacteriota bacterium]
MSTPLSLSETRSLARAATIVENQAPGSQGILEEASAHPGHGRILGITGAPGVGKSSLVDALAQALRRESKTVAILAVDPSSRSSGGAILGDRIRMQQHHADPGIFIRSMATRGTVGGLAKAAEDVAKLLRSAGFDFVIVETVGVGQDEIEIAGLADVTVVVLVPGMGDDVQAIKAGIMEIADIFVVNKADYPGADRTEREVQAMLGLAHGDRIPPIVRTVATEGTGIQDLLSAIEACPNRKRLRVLPEYRIDHLGVAVRSIDAALEFYRDAFGMTVELRETVNQEMVHAAMLPAGEARIELLEPTEPDSVIGRYIEKRGEGLHHVALRVPDLAGVAARLRAAGARVLGEPQRGAGGHLYIFVHPASTGGVLLELIQD